jgi:DNA-binding winged helix-turn-helix (wHTH) protein
MEASAPFHKIRFGKFEVDPETRELFKEKRLIRLQGQPIQILLMLLDNPGRIVAREELQKVLWPKDTFVDFDHSLNAAIQRLREALNDSADTPRYIETLPRRGYRFIYPVESPFPQAFRPPPSPSPSWIDRIWSLLNQSPTPPPRPKREGAEPGEMEAQEVKVSPRGNLPEALQAEDLREGIDQRLAAGQVESGPPQSLVSEGTTSGTSLMAGQRLGSYEVLSLLAKGGMGEVYRAEDTNLGRQVALKVLPEEFSNDSERLARFEHEARLLASLNHPNIAAIYGLEQAGGKRFLVLELVEGETLAERLTRGRLPLEEALGVCLQIAEGVEAAH